MRKRAERRSKLTIDEPKHIAMQMRSKIETKPSVLKKNWWIAVSLISIFLILILFNTYFNLTSGVSVNPEGEGLDKYYLSGPDPYYNMRLVKGTYETGRYPYYSVDDPLLKYPQGAKGGRAPLLNMMAIGFSRVLAPFMNEIDAIGYSMQFVPALFGALLIFPVYYIGKELFNKKAGLIGAMLVAIIPIEISSGHGSAYTLFDHDSLNLLLFFLTFLFLIKSLKEKDSIKSILYAVLAGIPLAALSMVWIEAQFLYVIIAIYAIIQMFIDIFLDKVELRMFRTSSIVLFTGYLVSLPVTTSAGGIALSTPLFLCIVITVFGAIYYFLGRMKIPWTLSLPVTFTLGGIGLIFLYFIRDLSTSFSFLSPLQALSETIFGKGIYGNKVSMTIAEANTYEISNTVMSFGPSLYWLAWGGFILLLYYYYKNKQRRDYLFIIVLFIIDIWLSGTAGRFLNDMVPLVAILGAWIVWIFIDWIDYKQMIKNIRGAGGGIHGIRRGIKFLHIFGIIFVFFIVLLPNVFIAFDAAVPNSPKQKSDGNWTSLKGYMFNDDNYRGAFGLSVTKEEYWTDAFSWLNKQDTNIADPTQRPAFISWWDYGFYEVAIGGHPTVADNFQDGIPTAANFHTSIGEKDAVIVLSILLLDGYKNNYGQFSENVLEVLRNYIGENNTRNVTKWIEDPSSSPSYGTPIGAQYDEKTSKDYTVGQQYPDNAVYHDIVELLTNQSIDPETNETIGLNDEEITWLYHDLQETTGYSVRYYGVEGYDKQIFNIFGFLADKSLLLVNGIADDFVEYYYTGYEVDQQGNKIEGSDFSKPAKEIVGMSLEERRYMAFTGTNQAYKDSYFETMFYKTYIGPYKTNEDGTKAEFDYQVPCIDMKHFYAEYMSDLSKYQYLNTGKASVVIAKYYEGAYVNGTVTFFGEPVDAQVVISKNLTYYSGVSLPIDHDKNDTVNGTFHLIAGANPTLTIRRYPELGASAFIYKVIYFDNATDSAFYPITDDDAMRKNGSNYERFLNITIDPASIDGYIYTDKDDDGSFNVSIDETISDVTVNLIGVNKLTASQDQAGNTNLQPSEIDYTMIREMTTNETGYYNFSELKPGYYIIETVLDNIPIDRSLIQLASGLTSTNISKPKPGALEGMVFYDANQNDEYESGEEIKNANVELLYNDANTQNRLISKTNTGDIGNYSFTLSIPGNIKDLDINEYTLKVTKDLEYQASETIYPKENMTTTFNISVSLTPISVTGNTKYNDKTVGDITIDFSPDESLTDNTAEPNSTTSDLSGYYLIDLTPGHYNVTVVKMVGEYDETLVYSYEGKLILTRGQGSKSGEDIILTKYSVNVSGKTLYQNTAVPNVTINFENVSNDLITEIAKSDATGLYSIELAPGTYNVTAVSLRFEENGKNYTYKWTGVLELKQSNIQTGVVYNIELEKILKEG